MASKNPRRRATRPAYLTEQVVIMVDQATGNTLKADAWALGVSQAELARVALKAGYRTAVKKISRERGVEVPIAVDSEAA